MNENKIVVCYWKITFIQDGTSRWQAKRQDSQNAGAYLNVNFIHKYSLNG